MAIRPRFDGTRRRRLRLIAGPLASRPRVARPLKSGIFLLPAAITSVGLLSGFYSLIASINSHFELAAVMIAVAFVCDGLDGRVARLSRTSSQFGVEYDSISDVVAFGVAPAGLIYCWALKPLGDLGWVVAGMYVVCAALRLARFNVQVGVVDKRRFTGLPVPGAAGLIASLVLVYSYLELDFARTLTGVAVPMTLALAGLMVSRVPYPSFKAINFRQRAQFEMFVGVLLVLGFLLVLPQISLFLLALSYVLSGPILMLRGERLAGKAPVLKPVQSEHPAGNGKDTGSLTRHPLSSSGDLTH